MGSGAPGKDEVVLLEAPLQGSQQPGESAESGVGLDWGDVGGWSQVAGVG